MRVFGPKITTENCMEFPFGNELFTFSTGFSTVFVKKKGSFPCGFPLFPPGFPQCKCSRCIHGVILRQGAWDVLGEKEGVSPFIKKKVEAFSFHFTVRCGVPVFGSPIWNERGQSFQHRGGCKPRLWKMRGKAQFSTRFSPPAEPSQSPAEEQTERVGCKNKPSRADKVPERAYKTIFYALAAAQGSAMRFL